MTTDTVALVDRLHALANVTWAEENSAALREAVSHITLVERIARMRLGSELSAMGFPGLAHEGVFAAIDAVIVEARKLADANTKGSRP